MAYKKVNLVIDQGATFNTTFTILDSLNTPMDFTNYTGAAQMRKSYTASTAYVFSVGLSSNGVVTLTMSADTTDLITAGRYVYDVVVQDHAGAKSRIVEGIATVTPRVTR